MAGYSLRRQPTAGSWLVVVSAGVGRQVTKVVHAPSELKAHKAAQRILPDLHARADKLRKQARTDRTLDRPDVMTLARLTEQWLRARETEGRTPTTLAQYQANADRWTAALGKRPVADLTPDEVDDWLSSLHTKAGDKLTASTRRQILGDLHNCLTWGHQKRRLPTPVTKQTVRPGHKTKDHALPEMDSIVDAAGALEVIGSDVAGMALLAMGLGLREGEVCGLRWVDVGPRLRVAGALKRDGTWGETKGRRARTVPISKVAKAGIDIAERRASDSSPWLFPTPADPQRARRPDWLSRQWANLAPQVGLDGMTFHGLRHVAGSTLLRGGMSLPEVSRVLGHSNTRITAEVYAHVIGELGSDALDVLDRAFGR